jgi:hypothetical protein
MLRLFVIAFSVVFIVPFVRLKRRLQAEQIYFQAPVEPLRINNKQPFMHHRCLQMNSVTHQETNDCLESYPILLCKEVNAETQRTGLLCARMVALVPRMLLGQAARSTPSGETTAKGLTIRRFSRRHAKESGANCAAFRLRFMAFMIWKS